MQPVARTEGWDEGDSREFIAAGRFFVPDREEQIETVCRLVPEPAAGGAHIVELCCGEGLLAGALLERFPAATVHGYDRSPAMLGAARQTLARHGSRFTAQAFDLADRDWRRFPWPVHAFVSSLAVHHLDGPGKALLYADLHAALAPGGAVVIADLVRPATAEGWKLAAAAWDTAVEKRVREAAGQAGGAPAGAPDPVAVFRAERWNFYADPDPDPIDQPSSLLDQLRWLEAAGFAGVDVAWMKAGHAIFGGRKAEEGPR